MFSVVIPTHDRLDLLRDAVESVLGQDFPEWELIVFDNASAEDIKGFVESIHDPRVRYERSEVFLPVTDSWNRAINFATRSYVTFLGDDDGLTPGYFTKMAKIIASFGAPEVLYNAIYQFLHPGVAPWELRGYVADVKNGFFFANQQAPFYLSEEDVSKAVHGSVSLRRNFTFNMQAFCFRQEFLNSLRLNGPVFRSPFPDYYLANIALIKAKAVVVIPEPLSIVGVSKASYGYTLFNGLEARGAELLNTKLMEDPLYREVEKQLLPGPSYNTNYVLTMQHVCRYAGSFMRHGVAFGRYRRLQIYRVLSANDGRLGLATPAAALLWSRLGVAEKLWAVALSLIIRASKTLRLYGRLVSPIVRRFVEPYAFYPPERIIARGRYSRLMEIFKSLQTNSNAPDTISASSAEKPVEQR